MLNTEKRNPKTMHLDQMTPLEIVRVMNEENAYSVACLEPVLPQIARAIEAIAEAFAGGGRLFYLGAGTSGRLAILDAAECPPTFGVSPDQVVAIIAGGFNSLVRASENAEDDPEEGIRELKAYRVNANDVVVGISAAGGAAFVCNALVYAAELGCTTVGITSNPGSKLDTLSHISIAVDTGPEVLTGSTRLKAGNVQKMVLNMLTTGAMVRSGHVYENLMINLKPSNVKLKGRVIRITAAILDCSEEEATALLEKNDWNIRKTVESVK